MPDCHECATHADGPWSHSWPPGSTHTAWCAQSPARWRRSPRWRPCITCGPSEKRLMQWRHSGTCILQRRRRRWAYRCARRASYFGSCQACESGSTHPARSMQALYAGVHIATLTCKQCLCDMLCRRPGAVACNASAHGPDFAQHHHRLCNAGSVLHH